MPRKTYNYNPKQTIGYKSLWAYIRLLHDYFYYHRAYWIDIEKLPRDKPALIVSNHQNGFADPLGFVSSVTNRLKRRLRFLARGDAFKPMVERALRWLGILPAYRTSVNGEASAAKNRKTFSDAEDELLADGAVVIYPEAGHQDKRWLGKFSPGYLHIAFEAARKSNFEKEIFVQPVGSHYSDYFNMREQMLFKFGDPISLAPYYEKYQADPRRAQVEANHIIRDKVAELMLNITDLENYDAIDYLRETYGIGYAHANGCNPDRLPEKLTSDQQFFARLEEVRTNDPDTINSIYRQTDALRTEIAQTKIDPNHFGHKFNPLALALKFLGLLALSPLFLFACVPNILVFYAPRLVTRNIPDRLQHSGIIFTFSILLTMPVLYLIVFALTWIFTKSALIALGYFLLLPFLGVFAFHYSRWALSWSKQVRFRRLSRKGRLDSTLTLNREIHDRLDAALDIKTE